MQNNNDVIRNTEAARNSQLRVLIADSTRIGAQLLAEVLGRDGRFRVVHCCTQVSELMAVVMTSRAQVALLSAKLEDEPLKGCVAARELRMVVPDLRTIVLLDSRKRESVIEAFRAGAKGVFCRGDSIEDLCKCIHCVHKGQIWANSSDLHYLIEAISESMRSMRIVDSKGMALLSKREQEVVRWLAEGLTNREIAERLKLSEHTIKNYLFNVFDKLGVSSRIEVILYAFSYLAQNAGALEAQGRAGSLETGAREPRREDEEAMWVLVRHAASSPVAQLALGQMYRDGCGTARDEIAAYVWFSLAESAGNDVGRSAGRLKECLAATMLPQQIAEAEQRRREWASSREMLLPPEPANRPNGKDDAQHLELQAIASRPVQRHGPFAADGGGLVVAAAGPYEPRTRAMRSRAYHKA